VAQTRPATAQCVIHRPQIVSLLLPRLLLLLLLVVLLLLDASEAAPS
jgi:hypothetical protein